GLSNRSVRDLLRITTMCRTPLPSSLSHDCARAMWRGAGQIPSTAAASNNGAKSRPGDLGCCNPQPRRELRRPSPSVLFITLPRALPVSFPETDTPILLCDDQWPSSRLVRPQHRILLAFHVADNANRS